MAHTVTDWHSMDGDRAKLSAAERAIASLAKAQDSEPGLSLAASELLTFNGYVNALADLAGRAKSGGDRDENASMNVECKALKMFAEIHSKVLEHQLDAEGTRKLQELLDQIGRRESGATTSFDDGFDPPSSPNEGAN